MARRKKTPPGPTRAQVKKGAFLDAYRKIGTVSAAARVAGIDRRTHTKWMHAKDGGQYAAAFADAQEDFVELLEQEARRRGVVGWDEPVVYQGAYCYETDPTTHQRRQVMVRKFDSMLLQAQLNAHRPEKYRYRHEHTGPWGGPIPHKHAGQIVVIGGDKTAYMAGLQKAREAVTAGVSGDGHGDKKGDTIPGDGHGS